jgi:hypothetical protein
LNACPTEPPDRAACSSPKEAGQKKVDQSHEDMINLLFFSISNKLKIVFIQPFFPALFQGFKIGGLKKVTHGKSFLIKGLFPFFQGTAL